MENMTKQEMVTRMLREIGYNKEEVEKFKIIDMTDAFQLAMITSGVWVNVKDTPPISEDEGVMNFIRDVTAISQASNLLARKNPRSYRKNTRNFPPVEAFDMMYDVVLSEHPNWQAIMNDDNLVDLISFKFAADRVLQPTVVNQNHFSSYKSVRERIAEDAVKLCNWFVSNGPTVYDTPIGSIVIDPQATICSQYNAGVHSDVADGDYHTCKNLFTSFLAKFENNGTYTISRPVVLGYDKGTTTFKERLAFFPYALCPLVPDMDCPDDVLEHRSNKNATNMRKFPQSYCITDSWYNTFVCNYTPKDFIDIPKENVAAFRKLTNSMIVVIINNQISNTRLTYADIDTMVPWCAGNIVYLATMMHYLMNVKSNC